jgi:arginine repressor
MLQLKRKSKEKEIARGLRLQGLTYDEIISELKKQSMTITRACLSKWFSKLKLPKPARVRLARRWVKAREEILSKGREKLYERWNRNRRDEGRG